MRRKLFVICNCPKRKRIQEWTELTGSGEIGMVNGEREIRACRGERGRKKEEEMTMQSG